MGRPIDANRTQAVLTWSQIDWRKIEKTVLRLQHRIFMAKVKGDVKGMESLQRLGFLSGRETPGDPQGRSGKQRPENSRCRRSRSFQQLTSSFGSNRSHLKTRGAKSPKQVAKRIENVGRVFSSFSGGV